MKRWSAGLTWLVVLCLGATAASGAGAPDGFYFVVSREVTQIKFDFDPRGVKQPWNRIFIGREQVHPSRCPFVLRAGE